MDEETRMKKSSNNIDLKRGNWEPLAEANKITSLTEAEISKK